MLKMKTFAACLLGHAISTLLGGASDGLEVSVWDDGLHVRNQRVSRLENEHLGGGQCQPCVAGKYQAVATSTGQRTCLACPPATSSAAGALSMLECHCIPGFTGFDGGPCTACAGGMFKRLQGTGECVTCGAGTYSGDAASACTACEASKYDDRTGRASCEFVCPQHTSSAPGSTTLADCSCSEGYTGAYPDTPCVNCAAGTFKSVQGSGPCVNCVAGKFSAAAAPSCTDCAVSKYSSTAAATHCVACDANAEAPAGSTQKASCECQKGYSGPDGGPCASCEPGTYKGHRGSEACQACSPGKISTSASATACAPCASGKYANTETRVACVACPAGKAGANPGAAGLAQGCDMTCSDGKFSAAGATACSQCPIGTYGGAGGVCSACPAGKSSFAESASVSECYAGVVCERGFVATGADGLGNCTACPPGWTTPLGVFPQVCSEPCSSAMRASASSGCTGAWYASTARADGCSEGSCSDVCSARGRSCAASSMALVTSRSAALAVARVLLVNCSAQTCDSSSATCREDGAAGVVEATTGMLAGLSPTAVLDRFSDTGPCYFATSAAGSCDASNCDAHRFCPCA